MTKGKAPHMLRRSAKLGTKRKPQKEFDISFGGLHKKNEEEKKEDDMN